MLFYRSQICQKGNWRLGILSVMWILAEQCRWLTDVKSVAREIKNILTFARILLIYLIFHRRSLNYEDLAVAHFSVVAMSLICSQPGTLLGLLFLRRRLSRTMEQISLTDKLVASLCKAHINLNNWILLFSLSGPKRTTWTTRKTRQRWVSRQKRFKGWKKFWTYCFIVI